MINRAAVILKCKAPFIKWVNDADPYKDDPGITIESVNQDRTVYLILEDDAEKLDEWISLNFKQLFESELEDWYTDELLWPKKRNRKKFDEWFEVQCHSVLIDTVGSKIVDDEI
ncbi:MAG: hypothetical protein U9Q91_06350 [Candidatus Marinimicrobia bacterium]|nr:hypothetical protein [Candidatus Neomarinimicrobiota bacterium]